MSTPTKWAFAGISLVLLVAGFCFARRWREFAPAGEGFTVSVPGNFTAKAIPFDTWTVPTGKAFYEARAGAFRFVVGHVDLPATPADDQVLRTWSYHTWMAVGRDAGASMRDPAPASLAGTNGEEARGRSEGDRQLIVRVAYLDQPQPRMVVAAVEAPQSLIENGHADRFFASLATR